MIHEADLMRVRDIRKASVALHIPPTPVADCQGCFDEDIPVACLSPGGYCYRCLRDDHAA